jgi:hypothetical protein
MSSRNTLQAPDRRSRSWRDPVGKGELKGPAQGSQFARETIGFWLGGAVLGTAGCILGALVPYHHSVARVISALWWGIYCGCLGASIGALVSLVTKQTPAPSARKPDDPGKQLGCGLISQRGGHGGHASPADPAA